MLLQQLEVDSAGEPRKLLERIKSLPGVTVILAISTSLKVNDGVVAKDVIEAISKTENYGRAKFYWFDVDESNELYSGFSMGPVPGLIILKDGKEVTFTRARFSGIVSRVTIESALDIIMDPARSLPAQEVQPVALQP